MSASFIALGITLGLWLSPFALFAGWLIIDRRHQNQLRRRDAHELAATLDTDKPVEVRPHLYVAAERVQRGEVIDARARFAARRHQIGGAA